MQPISRDIYDSPTFKFQLLPVLNIAGRYTAYIASKGFLVTN